MYQAQLSMMTASCLFAFLAVSSLGQTVHRISLDSQGGESNGKSRAPSVSWDGRFAAFESAATNLVTGDANGTSDVFVHDRSTGTTTRVSVDSQGLEGLGPSQLPAISADGRYVAFVSFATNLVSGDTNQKSDVFVHDRATGETVRASVDDAGHEGNGDSGRWRGPSISADGRFVAFNSEASNLVSSDTNAAGDVFVHDLQTHHTTLVSVDSNGVQGNAVSMLPLLSQDGRFLAFSSKADNLVPGDRNGYYDGFLHDCQTGSTIRVTLDAAGGEANGQSMARAISADGQLVLFVSEATNLIPGGDQDSSAPDVFMRSWQSGETTLLSVDSHGHQANRTSGEFAISMSADGRLVVFDSFATNLVPDDTNAEEDVFLHDRLTGETRRLTVDETSAQADGPSGRGGAVISRDGRFVAFESKATNLVAADQNGAADIFVHAPLSLAFNGTPRSGSPFSFTVSHAGTTRTGDLALVLLSCSGSEERTLPGGYPLYLTFDACTVMGLWAAPWLSAAVDDRGRANTPVLTFPDAPLGFNLDCVAVLLDPTRSLVAGVTAPLVVVTQ